MEDDRAILVRKALAGMAGAGIGLVFAGPLGALAGAAATPWVEALLLQRREYGARNADQFIEATSDISGMSTDELQIWSSELPERNHLMFSALLAAYSAVSDERINALARSVNEAVKDDTRLDMSQVMVDTLAVLDPPHVKILRSMIKDEPIPHPDGEQIAPGAWTEYQLTHQHPELAAGMVALITRLLGVGAVDEGLASNLGRAFYVTTFGHECMEYLSSRTIDSDT